VKRVVLASGFCSLAMSFLGMALAAQLFFPAASNAQTDEVNARVFRIVGSDGAVHGEFGENINPQGQTGYRLGLIQDGQVRANMAYGFRSREATALSFRDTTGKDVIRISLKTGVENNSVGDLNTIAVLDDELQPRVLIGVDGDGSPFIEMLNADGTVSWSAR
jgi:hypothetical protein